MTDSEIVASYRSRLMAACATRDAQELADVAHEMLADLGQMSTELDKAEERAETYFDRANDAEQLLEERYTLSEVNEKTSEMQAEHESEFDALSLAHAEELDSIRNPRTPLPLSKYPKADPRPYPAHVNAGSPSDRWIYDRSPYAFGRALA